MTNKTNTEMVAYYRWVADGARALLSDLSGSQDPETIRIAGHLADAAQRAEDQANRYGAGQDLEDAALDEIADHQRRIEAARQQS